MRNLIDKDKALETLHELGGCDAKEEFYKGWDSAINTAYDEVAKIKVCKIHNYLLILALLICGLLLGFAFGKQHTIENAKITYEEREGTKWCYLSIDGYAYAYDCKGDGGVENE